MSDKKRKPKTHVELELENRRLWLELKKTLLDIQFQNTMRKAQDKPN